MISPTFPRARSRDIERGLTISLAHSWHRILLLGIVALSAVLDFTGLSREGYNNEFYAAAVRSMSESWHHFFFNSFDPGGFVTIDKPPLGFWFQVLSVKLFGFNGVALLLPQALAGVLSVGLLYYLVSRSFGRWAGSISALALAVTPISVVTARNNTIDSTLVLFVLLGAWAVLRAAESGKLRWLLLGAVLVGLGFNIKMLEAYLVVPAFGLMYLLGTRKSIWKRLGSLALALAVLLAISLSWATAVDLTAASQRPWVDSTTTNSELNLALGYNGLQRLTGTQGAGGAGPHGTPPAGTRTSGSGTAGAANFAGPGGGAGGGPGGIGENGPTGALRLLDTQLGSQIGWLLPLAVIGFFVALWRSQPRFRILNEEQRSLVLWGTWLLTTGVFFSVALFYHTYYLVMVAPAICALAGIAVVSLWREYRQPGSRLWWLLPVSVLIAGAVQVHILSAYPSWSRWLAPLVMGGCILAAVGAIFFRLRPFLSIRAALASTAIAVLALLGPSTAFAAYTAQHTQTGAILRAGPSASGVSSGPGDGFAGGLPSGVNRLGGPPVGSSNGSGVNFGPPPNGAAGGFGGSPSSRPGGGFGGPPSGRSFGRPDGQVSSTLITYLEKHRGTAKYLVATPNSNEAAPIIIATGLPVMSLGGFTGSDPILTTAKLAALANAGEIRYFLLGGGGGPGGGGSDLSTWIQRHSKVVTVGGSQLYEYTG